MRRRAAVVLYVLALVVVVVAVDILFFRHQFWERLIANVGIVVLFAAFYLRLLKRRWEQRPQGAPTRPR
jgi:positive regulator of sigma E activity